MVKEVMVKDSVALLQGLVYMKHFLHVAVADWSTAMRLVNAKIATEQKLFIAAKAALNA